MDLVDQIAVEASRVTTVADGCDLATPVPWLGRWKVRDVVAHLGGVHRWADRIVTARSMDGPGFTKSKLDGAELLDWFGTGATALVSTLSQADPGDPCPNFNPGSVKTVGWWVVRQLLETTVHRWDVEAALAEPAGIDVDVASMGIGEYLDTFVRTRGKQTATGPVVITTTDTNESWTISLAAKPGRVDVVDGAVPDGESVISGSSPDLLLTLWRRRPFDDARLSVAGDRPTALAFLGV